jgi:MerR family redox-sensitive transcriptional activator SoxR
MSAVDELTIGEVARRASIRPSAIRYYEQVGLLPAPPRKSGQRRYDPSVLYRLALIQFAQEAGFTITEIHTLFEGFEEETPASVRWQILAQEKLNEVDALIARAERMKGLLDHALECRCLRLADCARILAGNPRATISLERCDDQRR